MNHSENFEQLRKQIEVDAKSINLVEISRQFIKVLNRMDELESALIEKQKNPEDVFRCKLQKSCSEIDKINKPLILKKNLFLFVINYQK